MIIVSVRDIVYMTDKFDGFVNGLISGSAVSLILIIYISAFQWFLLILWLFHGYLISTNNTTNECLKDVKAFTSRSLLKNWKKLIFNVETISKMRFDEEVKITENDEIHETRCNIKDKLKDLTEASLVR